MKDTITFSTFFIMNGDNILAGPFGNVGCAIRKKATYKKKYYPHLTIVKKDNIMELEINGDGTRR